MSFTPGTFLWLVAHDLKLNWRRFTDMLGNPSGMRMARYVVAGMLLLHLLSIPAMLMMRAHIFGSGAVDAKPSLVLAATLVCTLTWMCAQSLFGTARALYTRGDLDLLLGSPILPAKVFAAKAAAIAASAFGSIAFLTLPVANVGVILDRVQWLGCYAVMLAYALIAAAVGIALSIALFFACGPRRARVLTQLTGVFIGGAFVLVAQVLAMLPARLQDALHGWIEVNVVGSKGALAGMLMLPVRAVRGDFQAMTHLLLIGVALFAIAVALLGDRFATASVAAAGAPSEAPKSKWRERRFASGVGQALRRKELLLLARDPSLFAQLGLQIIYTVPVAVVLMRSEALPVVMALAPTVVVIASQVSASLAWLTVSGEDAPELIASAPVDGDTVDRAKLTAIALPVSMILAVPILGLAFISLPMAAVTALFAGSAAATTALLNFWHPMPGNRRGMLRRHSQSKLVGMVEHGLSILWAVAVMFTALGSNLVAVPLALVFCILLAMRGKRGANAPRLFGGKATVPAPMPSSVL